MATEYIRGARVAHLAETAVEVPCLIRGRPSYRWARRLALINPITGEWLYSEHWPLRATKKADKELSGIGWSMR